MNGKSQEDYERCWRWSGKDYKMVMGSISRDSIYTFHSPRRQQFSLPFEFISHILHQKKSAVFLLKLYQTCKHFFTKHRVLPMVFASECNDSMVYSNKKYFNFGQNVLFWFNEALRFSRAHTSLHQKIYCCTLKELSFS